MSRVQSAQGRLAEDPGYPELKARVIESTGLAYYKDRDEDLSERIARRLSKLGLKDCASYLGLLSEGPAGAQELDELIVELTIGETYFFRYPEQFEALRDIVLPDLAQRRRSSRRLRIWSAGCASGPEPYSLSLLTKRELGQSLAGWDVSILGTDINRRFLAQAREARYGDWALRATPEEIKRSCFSGAKDSWALDPQYKGGVCFQYHNLVKHPFPSLIDNLCAFDLILCRNVMIYLQAEINRRIAAQFHRCLQDGGWLLIGEAEADTRLFRSFLTVNVPGAVLYQKKEGASESLPAAPHVGSNALPERAEYGAAPAAPAPQALPEAPPPPWSAPLLPPEPAPHDWKDLETGPSPQSPAPARPLEEVRLLADQGRWEEASELCRRALEKDSLNPLAHFYYALILEQIGLADQSEESLRRALYLERNFVLAHYHLGVLLQKTGRLAASSRSFQNALTLLFRLDKDRAFPEADGIKAGELQELAKMHLEVLSG